MEEFVPAGFRSVPKGSPFLQRMRREGQRSVGYIFAQVMVHLGLARSLFLVIAIDIDLCRGRVIRQVGEGASGDRSSSQSGNGGQEAQIDCAHQQLQVDGQGPWQGGETFAV